LRRRNAPGTDVQDKLDLKVATMKAHVWWSIYVRTPREEELRHTHLPPIADSLEKVEYDWDVSVEQENPGLFRLVNCQNLQGTCVEEIVLPVLRRAYRLGSVWTISGLEVLSTGVLKHLHGNCDVHRPSRGRPSLESIAFEVEAGHMRRATKNEAAGAGWSSGAWRRVVP
jgi:hypothetical protein